MSDMDHFASSELMRAMDSMMPVAKSDGRTQGKVTKVEPDGTVWVALRDSRGTVEMPCKRSVVAAKPGDTVAVTVRERRAIVESNISSPAATVEQTEGLVKTSAQELADNTNQLFQSAISDAQAAHEAAGRAEADATRAAVAAESSEASARASAASAASAADSAASAAASAFSANESAESAYLAALGSITSLGTVENVIESLRWLKDNPAYKKCPDGKYIDPTCDYYQIVDGEYVKVENPTVEGIPTYYVIDATATAAAYVDSKLAVTDAGLYVTKDKLLTWAEGDEMPDGSGTIGAPELDEEGNPILDDEGNPVIIGADLIGMPKPQEAGYVLLGVDGVTIYSKEGYPVATYGSSMKLGYGASSTTIESDMIEVIRTDIPTKVEYNVFAAGRRLANPEQPESSTNPMLPFVQFSDGYGHDLFTVDSTGKPTFAKPVPIGSGGTDATNRGNAADNLLVQSIGSGMELPSAFDFNTLTAPGNFTFGWSVNVKNLTNRPSKLTSAFRLTVWKFFGNENDRTNEAIRVQVVHEYNTSRVFQRYSTNAGASWSAWVCQVRDNDVIDSAHGGLGSTSINGATGAVRTLFDTNLPDAAYITVFDDANDGGYMNMSQLLSKVGAAPRVHTHSSIYTIGDKREVATKPSDYTNQITFCGLKRNSVIGSPSSDAYSYVIGIRGWSDNSGGYTREIALNNTGMYIRKASGDTTWYAWYRVFDLSMTLGSANIANGAVTADKLASSSVTNAKLANGAVSAGKLDSSTQDLVKMEDRVATVATNMISGNNHLYLTKRGSVRVLTIDGSYGFNGDTASWSSYQIGSISSVVDRPVRSTSAPLYSDDGVMIVRVTGTGQIFIDTRNIAIRKGVSFFGQVVW